MALSPDRRAALLAEHARAERALADVRDLADRATGDTTRRLLAHVAMYGGIVDALGEAYRESVPVRALSRCPLTGAEVRQSLDGSGIDGLWWRYVAPVRPRTALPPTVFSFSGALALAPRIERTSFLVKPGPGAPFVVPALLADPGAVAVISQVPVGRHTGYAIFYFADPSCDPPRLNDWGTDGYLVPSATGRPGWGARLEDASEYDFALAPWIARKRLRWIAPGDAALTLRDDAACPFVDPGGTRALQRIQDGEVW